MRVALYLRRSTTDLQPDSLETQQEIVEKYAADRSHLIVPFYQDSASGRSVDGRDHFQELWGRVFDFSSILPTGRIQHLLSVKYLTLRGPSAWCRRSVSHHGGKAVLQ